MLNVSYCPNCGEQLVKLSCKIGSTVYAHSDFGNRIVPFKIEAAHISKDTIQFEGIWNHCGEIMEDLDFEPNDIGKTVFLTEKEAEEAHGDKK